MAFASGIINAYSGTVLASNSTVSQMITNVNNTGALASLAGNVVSTTFGGTAGAAVAATVSTPAAPSYNVSNSLMFNGSSQFLSRTQVAGNQKTFTISKWIKRGKLGLTQTRLWTGNAVPGYTDALWFNSSDQIEGQLYGAVIQFHTTAAYRDPSAWLHVVLAIDMTQSTSANQIKLWVNGMPVSLVFVGSLASNTSLYTNTVSNSAWIGSGNG